MCDCQNKITCGPLGPGGPHSPSVPGGPCAKILKVINGFALIIVKQTCQFAPVLEIYCVNPRKIVIYIPVGHDDQAYQ